MTPTLTIYETTTTDRIVFDCDHGTTEALIVNNTRQAPLQIGVQDVLAKHKDDCNCAPALVDMVWDSMKEARLTFERDAHDAPDGADAVHFAILDTMNHRACANCDPSITIRTHPSAGTSVLVNHQGACQKAEKNYQPPRATTVQTKPVIA